VKKNWKAAYSSLYSSYIAFCNMLVVVIGKRDILKNGRNYSAQNAKSVLKQYSEMGNILENCSDHLKIRHHLDHFWLIWMSVEKGEFLIDSDFEKGYVRLGYPSKNYNNWLDGQVRLNEDIFGISKNFNALFIELSKVEGYLDQYLAFKGWEIQYTDYGPPHYGERPKP
jgi:hypothetical protein